MRGKSNGREASRQNAFALGEELRESLVNKYQQEHRLNERPFLKDITDELITGPLFARLRYDPLPLDTFALTELVNGRVQIVINTRTSEMPRVRHVAGVMQLSKWHEIIHADQHIMRMDRQAPKGQLSLPGIDAVPDQIVCFWRPNPGSSDFEREFIAEHAGLSAAIAPADLKRSRAYSEFMRLARFGGDLGREGWWLLYQTAEDIGVSPTHLVKYLEFTSRIDVVSSAGQRLLVARPMLWKEVA
ncbi:MAG: hypothetical protein IT305_12145 [Chloroflexi bacterium]|nr:hypothetical protein [Chloroflexota bacterium]